MKLSRNLQAIAVGIIAGSLLLAGLAGWSWYAEGTESRCSQYEAHIFLLCHVVGAVGVIWLGWYWLKLVGGITSIAKLIGGEKLPYTNGGSTAAETAQSSFLRPGLLVNELSETINGRFEDYRTSIVGLEKQIRDLQLQVRLSQRQKRNTEAIIHSIRDAVIVVDEFDKLLTANEAAGRLFDFDFKNSQRKPIGELVSAEKSEFVKLLRQSRQGKVRHTRREVGFSKEDGLKIFDCIVSCVYDHREQVCGVVAVLHDITREKEMSQIKNDFVSHVSHELKTPLASIIAYSEMLLDGEADDEQTRKEFYTVIQSQAKRLNRLIENILNISRIESGLTKVEKEPVSLTILIEEQMKMIRSYAEEKNIEIVRQKAIVFDQVYADRDMISQVIVNLLSNAVKYTPCGGLIKVETEVDETAGVGRVFVTDTGVGIPEDELEHIFDKFYRVEANKSQAKGTGLGLNLVKQVVEKVHNGRVFVSSKVGAGSTFGFELPLATAKVAEAV